MGETRGDAAPAVGREVVMARLLPFVALALLVMVVVGSVLVGVRTGMLERSLERLGRMPPAQPEVAPPEAPEGEA